MKILITTAVCLCIFSSCSPVRVVSTQTNENADFSTYKTFDFFADDSGLTDAPNFQYLITSIAAQLEMRGLKQSDSPDLKINIAGDKQEVQQTRETDYKDAPVYMGTRNYHWESQEIVVRDYDEGTVKIDVVDAASNDMVWQGIVAGTLTDNQDVMKERIDKAIEGVFSKFPIKQK